MKRTVGAIAALLGFAIAATLADEAARAADARTAYRAIWSTIGRRFRLDKAGFCVLLDRRGLGSGTLLSTITPPQNPHCARQSLVREEVM